MFYIINFTLYWYFKLLNFTLYWYTYNTNEGSTTVAIIVHFLEIYCGNIVIKGNTSNMLAIHGNTRQYMAIRRTRWQYVRNT